MSGTGRVALFCVLICEWNVAVIVLVLYDATADSVDRLAESIETGFGPAEVGRGINVCTGFEPAVVCLFDRVGRSSAMEVMLLGILMPDLGMGKGMAVLV